MNQPELNQAESSLARLGLDLSLAWIEPELSFDRAEYEDSASRLCFITVLIIFNSYVSLKDLQINFGVLLSYATEIYLDYIRASSKKGILLLWKLRAQT